MIYLQENKHHYALFGDDNYDNRTVAEMKPLITRIDEFDTVVTNLKELSEIESCDDLKEIVELERKEFVSKKEQLFSEVSVKIIFMFLVH